MKNSTQVGGHASRTAAPAQSQLQTPPATQAKCSPVDFSNAWLKLSMAIDGMTTLADLLVLQVNYGETHAGESCLDAEARRDGLLGLHQIIRDELQVRQDRVELLSIALRSKAAERGGAR